MRQPLLSVSASPHILGRTTIRSMHIEILAAMGPALLVGLYFFGGPALVTVLLAVASALAAEYVASLITGWPNRLGDLHAALIGLLMAMVLPSGAPWWLVIVGGALAVVLGKMLYGGLGNYPMNPVLVAWVAMMLSWPEHMNAFVAPQSLFGGGGDWEQAQNILMRIRGDISELPDLALWPLWLGRAPGAIGAVSALGLSLGGVYLCLRRLIRWQIPAGVILGAVVMALFASYVDPKVAELEFETFAQHWHVAMVHLASGGLMLAAFFLAPEPVSSPVTAWGSFLYGLGIGLMAIIVRFWGEWGDGVFFGVLLMNAATPLFDRIKPKVVGKVVYSA